jgi:hypothetical protein
MPHRNATLAAKMMMPIAPLFFGGLGVALLATPLRVTLNTPSFAKLHTIVPLPTQAVILVVIAVLQVASMALHRQWYQLALGVGAVLMLLWTAVFIVAALEGLTPWTAPMWPLFVAVTCLSLMVSLETTRAGP